MTIQHLLWHVSPCEHHIAVGKQMGVDKLHRETRRLLSVCASVTNVFLICCHPCTQLHICCRLLALCRVLCFYLLAALFIMSWVVVIPKEGWTGNPSILLLVRHRLFKFFFWKFLFWFVFKIFFILFQKKDGRVTRPSFFWYDTNSGHRDLFAYRRPCGLSTCQSPRRSPSLTAPFILFHIICGSLARSLTHSAHSGQI